MADNPNPRSNRSSPPAEGQKILGMPRTTGLIVIGVAAFTVGYFVISRMSGSKGQGSGGGSGSGGGGGGWHGGGQGQQVRVIKEWQGHHHR